MIRERSIINYSLNFVSSIVLILLSKRLFRGYPISAFTLSILNSFSSGLYATVALRFIGQSPSSPTQPKTSFLNRLGLATIFTIFLLFSNMSLMYNSVATYQIFKSFVPPILMVVEWFQLLVGLNTSAVTRERLQRDYSLAVLVAFAILLVSAATNISFDANLHPVGLICGSISVLVNPLYQTSVQGEASSTIYDRTRFLQIQSFLSAALLLPLWPLIDSTFSTISHVFVHWQPLVLLALAGFAAFLVNASAIWCIKDDAPTGFNMVGQVKTLLIVFLGAAFFRERFALKQLFTLLGTIVGSAIYIGVSFRK